MLLTGRLLSKRRILTAVLHCTAGRRWSSADKIGLPPDLVSFLHQDIDFRPTSISRWVQKQKWRKILNEQLYENSSVGRLGHELAAANFITKHNGAVKFLGKKIWHRKNSDGKTYLPNKFVEEFKIEAIDASNTTLMYTSLEYFEYLSFLVYLDLSHCPYIDDWCLSKLHILSDTLRFLNLTGCPRVTERGLATLHNLEKLEGLIIADLPNLENKKVVGNALEEMLPDCNVIGVDYSAKEHTKVSEPETLLQWVRAL